MTPHTKVVYIVLLLMMPGFAFLILGIIFTFTGLSSLFIPGIVLLSVGVFPTVLGTVLYCRRLFNDRPNQQLPAVDHQHSGGCRRVVSGQPRTTPGTVQPPTPGASMIYGQLRVHPMIRTRTPGPANVMFRPGGGVMYLPDTQTNLQTELYPSGEAETNIEPDVSRSPGASAPPHYSEIDPEAPPPAYEEVIKQDTDPVNIGND